MGNLTVPAREHLLEHSLGPWTAEGGSGKLNTRLPTPSLARSGSVKHLTGVQTPGRHQNFLKMRKKETA